jgi:hypothetical protein
MCLGWDYEKKERLDYIFGDHKKDYITNRFGWLNALLSDIRTLIDGGQGFVKHEITPTLEGSHGAGNLSIPILVCTGIELLSALYVGKTKYMEPSRYNATENVRKFVNHFFQGHAKRIPILLWDGVRNGVDHLFVPKFMKFSENLVEFSFYVQDSSIPSTVTKSGNIILIRVNSIEFYYELKRAIEFYRNELNNDEKLQCNFIDAWRSIEKTHDVTRNTELSQEVTYLLKELNKSDKINLSRETK